MSRNEVSADVAINGFLQAVKDAAADNPSFRARLVEALGFTVLYEGEEQFLGANPADQASRWSEDAFTRIWSGARVAELKAVMKERDLATSEDMRGKNKRDLLALLYKRALAQAEETGRI